MLLYRSLFIASLGILTSTISAFTFAQETNLGDVLIRFCNDTSIPSGTKELALETDTNVDTPICIYVNNAGPNDASIMLNFVDGTVTNDAEQKKACQPEGTKQLFGQYVSLEDDVIEVAAGTTSQVTAIANFPAGIAGMRYGCITAQIMGSNETDSGMFKVVSRRANFVDILVNGRLITDLSIVSTDPSIANLSTNPDILIIQDTFTKEYKAKVTVKNNGNIAQDVRITPTIGNRFPQLQAPATMPTMTKKVLPGTSDTFEFTLDEHIPLWEGGISIDMDITHQAIIDFVSDAVTEADKTEKNIILSASFFVIPRYLIIALLALLLIIWILSSKKKTPTNRVYNESTPAVNNTKKSKKKITKKTKTPTKKDALTKIAGIGPKVQTVLYEAGIDSFEKLANTKVGDLRKLLQEHNLTRHDPKHWKKQATLAKNGKREELIAFQQSL